MQQILSLSQCDKNFIREVPAELNDYINFKLQLFVPQAMRLLAIDHNLANVINCFASTKNNEIFFPRFMQKFLQEWTRKFFGRIITAELHI